MSAPSPRVGNQFFEPSSDPHGNAPASQANEQIVTRPDELAALCDELARRQKFGLDTEFVGEDSYHPHLCLVQIATEDRLYLIDPLVSGPLDRLWNLITDPANLVVVHAGREEIRLCRLWSGRVPGNLCDLQITAGLVGLPYPLGHASLVNHVLGISVAKGETLTEWRDRPLTAKQIRYAFDDVRYLLPIWDRLSSELDRLGRADWAREEFARLAAITSPDEPVGEKWRRLRGIGSLDRRGLAMIRELTRWRDETAARLNRPVRVVVRDDLLVEIVRRNPHRESDLHVVRGLARRHVRGILDVIDRARSIPPDQCPPAFEREQDPPQAALLVSALSAVLGNLCARLKLAPNLVATNQDIKLLVRSRLQGIPLAQESILSSGWRSKEILPELQAFLDGRVSLRVTDTSAEAPFAVD
jgi:ribonuclease D